MGEKSEIAARLCGMGVRIPLPLLSFIGRCQTLTAAFLFVLRALFYAGFVPFLAPSVSVLCRWVYMPVFMLPGDFMGDSVGEGSGR